AELAKLGLTGASHILEGKQGLFSALSPSCNAADVLKGIGKAPLKITEIAFKQYACCRHTHSAAYAMSLLCEEFQIKESDIVAIVDFTYAVAVQITDNPDPQTEYAFKFSSQYCIAAMMIFQSLDDKVFHAEYVKNQQVRALMKKISVKISPELEA